MRHLVVSTIAVALAAAAFAGCGDDSNGSSSSGDNGSIETSSLSKTQFIKRADAICARDELLGPITSYMTRYENSGPSQPELAADAVQKTLVPSLQEQINDIRSLGAPAGDEDEIEAFLVTFEGNLDSLTKLQRLSLNPQLESILKPSQKLALAYGLESCF